MCVPILLLFAGAATFALSRCALQSAGGNCGFDLTFLGANCQLYYASEQTEGDDFQFLTLHKNKYTNFYKFLQIYENPNLNKFL